MAARGNDAGMVYSKGESSIVSLNFPNSLPWIHSKFINPTSPKDTQAAVAATTTSSVPATKPLFILSTQCFDEDESEHSSITSSNCGSQDFNQSSASSVSEATSSADEMGAMEDWIDTVFGELEPLQEPVDFFQEMLKEAEMVDAMGTYCFESQPMFQGFQPSMEGFQPSNQLADFWCLV